MKEFLLCGVLLLFTQIFTAQDFEVEKADINISINKDGYFDVQERYDLTFSEYKHGIYRDIQLVYDLLNEQGKQEKRRIKISKIKVPNQKFDANSFSQKFADDLEIRIGDEDETVIGPQHYEINYQVHNAFLYESEKTHFYWNIIPPNWQTTFHEVNFSVEIPEGVAMDLDDVFVYAGPMGTDIPSDEFTVTVRDNAFYFESKPGFESSFGESVTVLIKMPKDAVKEMVPVWPFWSDYGWTLILGLVIITFYWIWNKYGKDDRAVAAISYFPPDNIDSAMAGFLIDDSADSPDLISLIPAWGAKGIIRMEEIEKKGWFGKADTKLIKLKDLPADAPHYERAIFNGLFNTGNIIMENIMNSPAGDFLKNTLNVNLTPNASGNERNEVLVSSLKDSFYVHMEQAKKNLKSAAQIYYDSKAKHIMYGTIAGLVVLGLALGAFFLFTWGIIAAVATVVVFGVLLFFSQYLIKKNKKGTQMLSDIKGFKQFIKVAEQNKLRMLIEEDPSYFESTMAYALAFGLFAQWAKKFAALNISPPNWYATSAGMMSMNNFSQSFANTMQTAQKTMVSSPSGSGSGGGGGGSSGGGFGGGGGGSW